MTSNIKEHSDKKHIDHGLMRSIEILKTKELVKYTCFGCKKEYATVSAADITIWKLNETFELCGHCVRRIASYNYRTRIER